MPVPVILPPILDANCRYMMSVSPPAPLMWVGLTMGELMLSMSMFPVVMLISLYPQLMPALVAPPPIPVVNYKSMIYPILPAPLMWVGLTMGEPEVVLEVLTFPVVMLISLYPQLMPALVAPPPIPVAKCRYTIYQTPPIQAMLEG